MERVELIEKKLRLEEQMKSGANWSYWIAGLSLVNMVMLLTNGNWTFAAGLAITEFITVIAQLISAELGGNLILIIGLSINGVILGVFCLLGYFANQRRHWSFLTAIIIYSLDCIVFIFMPDIIGILFHILALHSIYRGMKANKQLTEIELEIANFLPAPQSDDAYSAER